MSAPQEPSGQSRFYLFILSLFVLFVGLVELFRWHAEPGWERGAGVWCTLCGVVFILISALVR